MSARREEAHPGANPALARPPAGVASLAVRGHDEGGMRYLHLLAFQLRLSLSVGMQYRWNFVVDGFVSLLWTALGLVPLYVALHDRPSIAGWTFDRALVVVGWFTLLKG